MGDEPSECSKAYYLSDKRVNSVERTLCIFNKSVPLDMSTVTPVENSKNLH